MTLYCQYILKYGPLTLNPEAATLHLTIIIFLLIHPPHPSSAYLILLLHHSIRLLNTILTPVINNRLVIPLYINVPSSLLGLPRPCNFSVPLRPDLLPCSLSVLAYSLLTAFSLH